MGEVADMMLDGTLCQTCGEYLGNPTGHPRSCRNCGGDNGTGSFDFRSTTKTKPKGPKGNPPRADRVKCRLCNKMNKKGQGEEDHMRMVHSGGK